jgi:hypothetical protein
MRPFMTDVDAPVACAAAPSRSNDLLCQCRTLPLIAIPAGGWSKDNVWTKLVQICVDQLQVESDQVNYAASFVDDLGAD